MCSAAFRERVRAIAAVAVAVLAPSVGAIPSPALAAADVTQVRVEGGIVQGVMSPPGAAVASGIVSFKGIPYAAPPVESLRWRAPQPPATWSGVRRADEYGASCPQEAPPRFVASQSALTMSEDCLTLNVWTPVMRDRPLPVMVWLHGGGNDAGTGSQTFYDGGAFARDGVVLVTLNYRLGLLGFFAHRSLRTGVPDGEFANYGLLDQIAALRWVRANIAAFGGDPGNVTLFGESAGAQDAILLASSEMARGLFRRAISESAPPLWDSLPALAQAQASSTAIARSLGLPGNDASAAQLRAVPVENLLALGGEAELGPIVDGSFIAAQPAVSLKLGLSVPVIIGTDEGDGSLIGEDADVASLFPGLSAGDLAFVRARYQARGVSGVKGNTAVARALGSAGFFAAPARWLATQTVNAGKPAYLYRFRYIASFFAGRRTTATHGSEIPFVFETFPPGILSETDRNVADVLHGCWVAFARTGKPDCPGAGPWQPFDPRSGQEMIFDAHSSVGDPGDNDILDLLQRDLLGHS